MYKFIFKNILFPFSGRWLQGIFLLLLWTISFIALPAISGWFLASCSLAFTATHLMFSYLAPSAAIRLIALVRTAMRYFERYENHKTTLDAQRKLQLKIFHSVAKLPYFKKQINNNSAILENSTYGIDLILNHILLWLLPLITLSVSLGIYFFFLKVYSIEIAIEFILSSAILLFVLPQLIFIRNKKLYTKLKIKREENNQDLIQSFRGRIEISKYNLEAKAILKQEESKTLIENLEQKLQTNSFSLQLLVGLGMSCISIFIIWTSSSFNIEAPLAIGIFFGIMAQAELSEMLFSGKSEKSSVANQIEDLNSLMQNESHIMNETDVNSDFESLSIRSYSAQIPETSIKTNEISFKIKKGEWIALYGETGKGKTTLLNSLFYPEYRLNGSIFWNDSQDINQLPVPKCIYVTQKAYLLTGTLGENFEGYEREEIEKTLKTVDLFNWYSNLPDNLNTWLGENGETLSGGQRKKLLLAQALLKNPQLLVVDEPTAGISVENALSIFEMIKNQHPEMSILMCTHLKDFENKVDTVIHL